jgi:uncharacterized membrane protein
MSNSRGNDSSGSSIRYFLLLATVATGLIAGLFFSFVVAINPAFAQLPDAQYIIAMQTINIVIVNPVFAFTLFSPVILIPYTAWRYKSVLLWIAAAFYIIGGTGVTFAANVPLNDMLAAFSGAASAAETRAAFAGAWNTWHLVRTVAVIISLMLLVMACLKSSDPIV